MKARLDMNMEKAGHNLMDPYNKYNDKTIDLIDEISRYSLFSGLGLYAPNISGTKNPLDSNYDPTHRLIIRVNLDNYQVSFYNSDKDKKSKVSYIVLPWDENHQQRLNQAMIKELQSKKKDFESEVKNYFKDKIVGAIIEEAKKRIPLPGPAQVAIGVAYDIVILYKETEEWNADISQKQNTLSIGDVYKALGIKATMVYSETGGASITAAKIDPVETRARIAYAEDLYNKEKKTNEKKKFNLKTYMQIYENGYRKNRRGWFNLTDKEKEKWREKYKNCTEEDIKNIKNFFKR
ncbi:hypothetical protein [Anaerosacchariphilus polymeriproducens]|uniref:Uncharacterized protein n=1 Tax=Anaerosacchariphilus polymeriproducens TaxID=1812858 RepID=A0A371AX95_9FIRM|nr:hypothetical protein [Anaerosacchariphilus polymeriproducens]RDU24142.1 hypothetical protein DWV06_05435 [Anaerosacchariphilus polymeriproducens]